MNKIYFQGTFGAYSHLAALSIFKNAKIIPCKTFDECFLKASKEDNSKIIIPESNRITGNIGIEYLIFKYRLNIYSEYFQKIEHNLLGLPGTKISEYIFSLYLKIKYSIPILPVILFDSGIIIFELSSFEAFKKHSSKVLHGIISASLKIDNAARCE